MKRKFKMLAIGMLITGLMMGMAGCAKGDAKTGKKNSVDEQVKVAEAIQTTPVVTMAIKDYGTITLELYPEIAPNTVNNFITLANDGFYDGLTFHRIIQGFMIQGGDPEGTGAGGPGYSISGEFTKNGFEDNTLSHTKGVISMARTNMPNSAGSQFFIMSADSPFLDGEYAAFGKVTSGIEIVETLESMQTNNNDKPIEELTIESIRVETNGVKVPEVIKVEK